MDFNTEKEVWKDVIGYEGKYKVSNFGNVTKQDGSLMAKCHNGTGYLVVYLSKDNKRKTKLIHRLVAEAFLLNKDNKAEINHIDENKQNNHMNNLEWCTRSYNASYGSKLKRQTENENYKNTRKSSGSHPKPMFKKKVAQYSTNGELIKIWDSAADVQIEAGYDRSTIGKVCRGKRQQAFGFGWKYI